MLYIQYIDANNLYRLVLSQKLPVDGFEWFENISYINEKLKKFIKTKKLWWRKRWWIYSWSRCSIS